MRPNRLTQSLCAAALLLVTSTSLSAARELKPGVERWAIKTMAPTTTTPKAVPLRTLLDLADVAGVHKNDGRFQDVRMTTPVNGLREGQLISTKGWVHLVAGEADGDYHIQISASPTSGDDCLIVEVPEDDRDFTVDARVRSAAEEVRTWFREKILKGREPSASGSVMQHPVFVEVVGALFYDDAHVGDQPRGKKGMKAATLWELHPVMSIRFAPKP